jgi:hypothetical protein
MFDPVAVWLERHTGKTADLATDQKATFGKIADGLRPMEWSRPIGRTNSQASMSSSADSPARTSAAPAPRQE